MTDGAALSRGSGVLPARTDGVPRPRQDAGPTLLVLTDEQLHGHAALNLPFHDATVVEAGADPGELDLSGAADALDGGRYDTVVVDRRRLELPWLEAATRRALDLLRPGGRVVIAFDPSGKPDEAALASTPAADPSTPALNSLAWEGLELIGGRPCALLREADGTRGPAGTAALLSAVDVALKLAHGQTAADSTLVPAGTVRQLLERQQEERRRSETSLLLHLDKVLVDIDKERGQRGWRPRVRAILRRSRAGRLLLRTQARVRRLAGSAPGRGGNARG